MASNSPFPSSAGSKVGLEAWRIEKLTPIAVDPKTIGSFHTGDAYILLNTVQKGPSKNYDLHFWLGSKSSQDEQGAAALMSVTLDDQLGGKPVQHREVEGHESPLFLSYFPKGIVYLDGGVESAFNKVEPGKYRSRLLHCKGKRHVRCTEVELKSSSLNEGDVFILDAGLTIYQWNGSAANKFEKTKGLEIASKIKDEERGGKAKIVHLESGRDDANEEFWKIVGGKAGVQSAAAGGDDEGVKADTIKLFRLSDASGSLTITSVAEGKLEKKMLDDNDAFIVDSGSAVYVWVGKGASKEERKKSLIHGQTYLTEKGRPVWTPLTRVIGGGEPPVFKALFFKWDEPKIINADASSSSSGKKAEKTVNISALYQQKSRQAEEKMLDASGTVEIWRIKDFNKVSIDKSEYGHFYSGDSYIVLYTYKSGTKESRIIYFWQGRNSSLDEKGTAALLAVDLDNQYGGEPTQVRVVQNKEPNHFLSLFKGKFIVHEGGFASGFHRGSVSASSAPTNRLYHVKGTTAINTRAIQVEAAAKSLNSNDTFILLTASDAYLWYGKGSNTDEKSFTKSISSTLAQGRKIIDVNEGAESADFWSALGGEGEYPSAKELYEPDFEPRLFQASSTGTGFSIEEIYNFSQDDLLQDSVIILDTYSEVFIWVGKDARKEDKDNSFKVALDYVAKAPDGRSAETPVFRVFAGAEPPNFSCHFHGWDSNKANDFSDPYLKKLGGGAGGAAAAAGSASIERVTKTSIGYLDAATNKHPLSALKSGAPPGVDPAKKEEYLSADEFKSAFGMDLASFEKLPGWKKVEAKKKAGLF